MTQLVYLDKKNCTVDYISNRNNVIVTITTLELDVFRNVAMNKKYFNQINSVGYVEGRLRRADEGLWLFEGFNFK